MFIIIIMMYNIVKNIKNKIVYIGKLSKSSLAKSNTSRLPLGRWSYVKNEDELSKRIYLANIDNCGPCGFDTKELDHHITQ